MGVPTSAATKDVMQLLPSVCMSVSHSPSLSLSLACSYCLPTSRATRPIDLHAHGHLTLIHTLSVALSISLSLSLSLSVALSISLSPSRSLSLAHLAYEEVENHEKRCLMQNDSKDVQPIIQLGE
jgi:hypothetical protein